jgi:hypothetical protein
MRFSYDILKNEDDRILIGDQCERHNCPSITNAAEDVIDDLFCRGLITNGKRVFYIDTMNKIDELRHQDGKFTSFSAGGYE